MSIVSLFNDLNLPSKSNFSTSPIKTLHSDINRVFGDFFNDNYDSSNMAVDVIEKEKELVINAEIPGVSKDKVDVSFDKNIITIKAEKQVQHKEDKDNFLLRETFIGNYQRSFSLPKNVDIDHAKAKFKDGLLTIAIPKIAEKKVEQKKISVE